MYLVLNKENDYKTNRSKIVAMETAYKSVNKLISLNEGDLTEEILLNIKEKQDLTNTSLVQTRNELLPVFQSLSRPLNLINLEFTTLEPEKLKAYENLFLGQVPNFVDMNLLTSIMKNEKSFSDFIKDIYNKMYLANENLYNDRVSVINKAISKGVYVPTNYDKTDVNTMKKSYLLTESNLEQKEFEKTFFQLEFKLPRTDYVGYDYLLFPNFYDFNYNIDSGITFSDSRVSFRTVVEPVNLYNEYVTVYCKILSSNLEFLIARFPKSTGVGSGDKTGYKITMNEIKIFLKKSSGDVWEYKKTLVVPPSKITADTIVNNF